ncbi:helix-turn-helix domain-containing protein [Paraburkholderia sp. BCC1885]|uniref:helix-turn-helix domain-containing protein n=1 Tax=Paraburkholderia sp. BCC1885 TaxID=2562669 RepID=UPI0021B341DD|nr:helix-turn-helix domain-containing protein [Paraburkholderia sp. BCC1885]
MDQEQKNRKLVRAVGRTIAVRRKARGLTQDQFSEAAGLAQASLSHIERGTVAPSLERIAQFAGILGCRLTDLIDEAATGPADRAMRIHKKLAALTPAQQESLERMIDEAISMVQDTAESRRRTPGLEA